MAITTESAYAVLRQVEDPELLVNLVDLGLIYEVAVAEQDGKYDIYVKMTMTSPACPVGPQMVQDVKDAIADLGEEVGEIEVEVTLSPPWTPERMSEYAKDELGMY